MMCVGLAGTEEVAHGVRPPLQGRVNHVGAQMLHAAARVQEDVSDMEQ